MSQDDSSKKKTQLFGFIVHVLGDHEKQMDHLANKLQEAKANFSVAAQRMNSRLDKINEQVDYIRNEIEKLKAEIEN